MQARDQEHADHQDWDEAEDRAVGEGRGHAGDLAAPDAHHEQVGNVNELAGRSLALGIALEEPVRGRQIAGGQTGSGSGLLALIAHGRGPLGGSTRPWGGPWIIGTPLAGLAEALGTGGRGRAAAGSRAGSRAIGSMAQVREFFTC